GDRPRARMLLEEILADTPAGFERGAALRLLAELAYNEESSQEALVLFEEALEHTDDPALAIDVELGIAYVLANLWDAEGAAAVARRALGRAEELGDDALVAQALAYCAMMNYLGGRDVDWDAVERALELEDPDRVVALQGRPSMVAGCLLLYVGRLAESRELL